MPYVSFISIHVVPHFGMSEVGGYDLAWTVNAVGCVPSFVVEESETQEGPWTPVNPEPVYDLFLKEASKKQLTFDNVRWFRIKALNSNKVLLATSQAVNNTNQLARRDYLYHRDLLRRLDLQLKKFVGEKGWLLRRKVYGKACPKCSSQILKQSTSSECRVCFGTGIEGGYYPAFEMQAEWLSGSAKSVTTTKESTGPTQVKQEMLRLYPIPLVKGQDVWVDEATRQRYRIENLEVSREDNFRGVPVAQRFVAALIPPKDPVYDVPVE